MCLAVVDGFVCLRMLKSRHCFDSLHIRSVRSTRNLSLIRMLQQLMPPQHRRQNGGEPRTLMCFFRFLVISLLTSASIAPLTAQTKQQIKQLPRGCAYMRVPVLESPFPYPSQKNGINMTRVVAPPQFLIHNLPSPAKSLLSTMPLFAESPSGFIIVCGLHSENW